jgi:hypothetical protein
MKRMKKKKSNAAWSGQRALRLGRGVVLGLFGVLSPLTVGGLLLNSASAVAEPAQRIVDGTVVDGSDKPISGAVVFLKDSKTLAVKSYLTDDAGHYRFGELSQTADYEIWAQSNGAKSKSKTISSFDNRNEFHFELKVSK